jgi:uncharacterized protein (TIGR00730 family)
MIKYTLSPALGKGEVKNKESIVMKEIKSVCVYCGSSSRVDESYKNSARELGKLIAQKGWRLVYGGGRVGLMGITADAALEGGSEVVGIIPRHIQSREIEHTDLTELHIVDTMHTRKQMMVERSDAFVIMPGGLGTLDEFFELLTWKQLGLHDKPIVMVNIAGYWTKLLEAVRHIADVKFMRDEDFHMFQIVERIEDVPAALLSAPEERFDPSTKWM